MSLVIVVIVIVVPWAHVYHSYLTRGSEVEAAKVAVNNEILLLRTCSHALGKENVTSVVLQEKCAFMTPTSVF